MATDLWTMIATVNNVGKTKQSVYAYKAMQTLQQLGACSF
jgi:hypothetical protein